MDLPDELARLGPSKDVGERLRVTFHGPPKPVNPPVTTKPLRTVPGRANRYEEGCSRGGSHSYSQAKAVPPPVRTPGHPSQPSRAAVSGALGLSSARHLNTIRSITCTYQPTSVTRFVAGRIRRRSTPRIPFGARDSGHGSSRNEALRW